MRKSHIVITYISFIRYEVLSTLYRLLYFIKPKEAKTMGKNKKRNGGYNFNEERTFSHANTENENQGNGARNNSDAGYKKPVYVCGKQPAEHPLPFNFTTVEVEKFLNERIASAIAVANEAGRAEMGENWKPYTTDHIEVVSANGGNGKLSFIPFIVMVPLSLTYGTGTRKRTVRDGELACFSEHKEDDGTANMIKPVDDVMKNYLFSPEDLKAFNSPMFRSETNMSRNQANNFRRMGRPRIMDFGSKGHKSKYCVFIIDPLRIFWNMLVDVNNPNQWFRTVVDSFQKQKDGSYNYHVLRDTRKPKNKNKNNQNILVALNRAVSGSGLR